jgi:hypothetical protein
MVACTHAKIEERAVHRKRGKRGARTPTPSLLTAQRIIMAGPQLGDEPLIRRKKTANIVVL